MQYMQSGQNKIKHRRRNQKLFARLSINRNVAQIEEVYQMVD